MRIDLLLKSPPSGLLIALAFAALATTPAAKKGFQVEPLKEAAPAEVSEKIRALLAAEGLRVLDKKGEPFVDVWLRKSISRVEPREVLNVKLGQIEEGAILGVLRFHGKGSDFRGNAFPAGSYTVRRGLQPVDGDHQGTAETRDFALLAPVKVDQGAEAMSTREAIKLSVQSTGTKHPTILWCVKVSEDAAKLPCMSEDETLELWKLECEIPSDSGDKKPVRLALVLVGKAPDH